MSDPSGEQAAPYQLLDDGFPPPACELLVVGCGNLLRGDDALGPIVARTLHQRGVPDGVRLIDGGTAGMDVAFMMRGAQRVVLVDAATTGAEPGTVYRIPAEELQDPPPLQGLHSHNFRWDHALSLAAWLLGPERPADITVLLVEAASCEPGAPLSEPVRAAVDRVVDLLEREFWPEAPGDAAPRDDVTDEVTVTADGYLHLDHDLARRRFPADVLVARMTPDESLELVPLQGIANGGLVLRQRNPRGDRTVLIHEVFGFASRPGTYAASWDPEDGCLRVSLRRAGGEEATDGRGRHDRGGARARPVDGLSAGGDGGGRGETPPGGLPDRGAGQDGRGPDPAYDGTTTRPEGVSR